MDLKIHLKICLHVIFCLCFEQVLLDVAAGRHPTSQKPGSGVADADLMFEFLLGGIEMDQDNNIILLDKELASMRSGRAFLSQINDNIPRSKSSMTQMVTSMQDRKMRRPLTPPQFQSLVLSMVYSAHQAHHQEIEEEQEAWGAVLLQLANVTVHELRGSHLFNYA